MTDETRNPPRWKTTTWHGRYDNYECTLCPFATLDRGLMVRHAREKHPRGWETDEPVDPTGLSGLDFASDEAAEHALELVGEGVPLTAADFDFTPSGKTGFTKADVKTAAKNHEE